MFGMEKKKKKPVPTVFDLESSLKQNPYKKQELTKNMENHIECLKRLLRQDGDKQEQQMYSFLLLGYQSFIKIINRID